MAEEVDPSLVGELLALVAHDLRNPLAALQSNLGFLEAVAPDDQDAKEAIEDGLASCDNLAHMIDNVDLFGRALRGAGSAAPTVIDLSNLVEKVAADTKSVARSHDLVVELDEKFERGVRVTANQDVLVRAVSNLVRNAIQHGGSGTTVRISVRSDGDRAVARIEDEGSRLAPELGAEAFTARGQGQAKSVPKGRYSRGLGLYVAGLAARVMGGDVRALDPERDRGNVFELSLPSSAT